MYIVHNAYGMEHGSDLWSNLITLLDCQLYPFVHWKIEVSEVRKVDSITLQLKWCSNKRWLVVAQLLTTGLNRLELVGGKITVIKFSERLYWELRYLVLKYFDENCLWAELMELWLNINSGKLCCFYFMFCNPLIIEEM